MDLLSVIRRWRLRDEIPLREIERRTGLSRNTIRKYLRADTVVPEFKVPDRSSKLDPFAEKLTGWLQIEAGKSRKQKRTAKQDTPDVDPALATEPLGFEPTGCKWVADFR